MNVRTPESRHGVDIAEPVGPGSGPGPVARFVLLIVPIVMNGFFVVYALAGWAVEGRDRFNWSLEAVEVGVWVSLGMLVFSTLVIAFTRMSGGAWRHPLVISSVLHVLFSVLVAISIVVLVRS